MELKDKYAIILDVLNCKGKEDFSSQLMKCVLDRDKTIYDKYMELFPDLSKDELRECWMFWYADREDKKQDYTSDYLAALIGALSTNSSKVCDVCSGSGSLSIGAWNYNHNISLVCEEFDEQVIPLLLFNLAVRNINAMVHHCDSLKSETFKSYKLTSGDKYSHVETCMFPDDERKDIDVVICNPPFNINGDNGQLQNYAFVRHALSIAPKAVFILPRGVLSSDREIKDRQQLIDDGAVRASVLMPGGFFSHTSIPVCVMVFGGKDDGVEFIDATSVCGTEIRDQRGEGDRSHTERIYHKKVSTLSASQISSICDMIERHAQTDVSVYVSNEEIRSKNYRLQYGSYIVIDPDESHTIHRAYSDIIKDINKITRMRNAMKVVCNKVWMTDIGLKDLYDMSMQSALLTESLNTQLLSIGIKNALDKVDYLSLTNSKELTIRQVDKEFLSPVIDTFVRLWGMHIRTMNVMENQLLAELRDALLPALMNGTLEIKHDIQ